MLPRLYFDWNASTPIRDEVRSEMLEVSRYVGNPSSVHSEGRKLRSILESARKRFQSAVGATSARVIWTSGATESNNMALLGLARMCERRSLRKAISTTSVEHPSVVGPLEYLESTGWSITRVPSNSIGNVDVNAFISASENASFVSVITANNEIGTILPIRELADRFTVPFHTDATQALGKISFSFDELHITAATFSGHKFRGPRGVGALVVSSESLIDPPFRGGDQEFGVRPGTENVAAIAGLALAAELAQADVKKSLGHISRLQSLLRERLAVIPGVRFLVPPNHCLPNTASLLISGIDGRSLVVALDLEGIACSVGSACASGSIVASKVLRAIGLNENEARSALRISMGPTHTEKEVEELCDRIARVVARLRGGKDS